MLLKTLFSFLLALSYVGNFAALGYTLPPWYDLISSTFEGVNLKRCFKRTEPPVVGTTCAGTPKTCFFGTQDCAGVQYPITKCFCDGRTKTQTWSCEPALCPGGVIIPTNPPDPDPETSAPVPAPETSAPVPDSETNAPVPAPETSAPVPDTETSAPVPGPTCPTLDALRDDPTCAGVFGCIYSFTSSNETLFCSSTETCSCEDGEFNCAVEQDCQASPTCSLSGIQDDPTCTAPGFGCTFTSTTTADDQTCTTVEQCDCKEDGEFDCVVESVDCVDAATCPLLADIIANPVCTANAQGLGCTTTSTASVGNEVCTTVTRCECDALVFTCSAEETCTPAPTCPSLAEISLDATCSGAEGLGCTFTSGAADVDNGEFCTTVNMCVCTNEMFDCTETVECVPIPSCPTSAAIADDPTCTLVGQACIFNSVVTVGDQTCETDERCDCEATGSFACSSNETCVDSPTCPSFEDFQTVKTCSAEGLSCTYTYSNTTETGDICQFTETCTCDGTIFDCELQESCQPAPTCPESEDIASGCDFAGLSCIYTGNNNDGTETCEFTNTCDCDGTDFTCVNVVGTCTTNPVFNSCPPFEDWIDAQTVCVFPTNTCLYTFTETGPQICTTTAECECDSSSTFQCTSERTCNVG